MCRRRARAAAARARAVPINRAAANCLVTVPGTSATLAPRAALTKAPRRGGPASRSNRRRAPLVSFTAPRRGFSMVCVSPFWDSSQNPPDTNAWHAPRTRSRRRRTPRRRRSSREASLRLRAPAPRAHATAATSRVGSSSSSISSNAAVHATSAARRGTAVSFFPFEAPSSVESLRLRVFVLRVA